MPLRNQISKFLAVGLLLAWPTSVWSQTVVATIPAGGGAVAVNSVTGKIYATTCILDQRKPATNGSVTVIDGKTYATSTLPAGVCPTAVAVNPVTNKIYVANAGQTSIVCGGSCFDFGSITIIDGATDAATQIADANAKYPAAIAVNSLTNKIYVANSGTGNVTVIDENTNSMTTITDPNAAGAHLSAYAIAVNEATNKIYVANNNSRWGVNSPGNITVIDGATNTTTTVTDPNAITPYAVAVNLKINKVYVANQGNGYPGPNHGNVTIIDGRTNSTFTVSDPNAVAPQAIAVNRATNQIYVANINDTSLSMNGGVTVIDGVTNSVLSVKDPNAIAPVALAVDPLTNKIYVANQGSRPQFEGNNPGCVTVIDGATNTSITIIDPKANGPHAVAVNPMVDQIYVANSGNVTVMDGGAIPTSSAVSVMLKGNGTGTVTSNPAGINCGTSCTASFTTGTTVSLAALAASGSRFSGWTTNCTGTGSCNLTLTTSEEFVTATFDALPPDFSIAPASANLTGQRGAQVKDVITIAPLNRAFSNVVQLSCAVTGSTPLATCSLSSSSVTPGTNSVTSRLTVAAPTQSAQLRPASEGQLPSPLHAAFVPIPVVLIALGLASNKSRNRTRSLWLLGSLFIAIVAIGSGCGGGSNNQLTPPPPLNYTVTVTATSGAIQHTTQVTLTVQ